MTAVVALLLSFMVISAASGQVDCSGALSGAGDALYYDYPGYGACGFTDVGDDSLVAAMNAIDYAGSAMCGRYIRVTGPLGTVDVRIVDSDPEGAAGDVDLNRPAFARIGPLAQGRVAVTWETIASPDTGPVSLYMDAASSVWWLAIQVRDHRYGIASLEYLGPSGYVTVPREIYNVFNVDSGLGVPVPLADPFDLRLTDVHGQVLEVTGVPISPGAEVPTSVQFPVCEDVSSTGLPSIWSPGFTLHPPVPNPFNPRTTIAFDVPTQTTVSLYVYDVGGRLVDILLNDETAPPGRNEVVWIGRDMAGRVVPAGVYFYRLTAGPYTETKRMVLVK